MQAKQRIITDAEDIVDSNKRRTLASIVGMRTKLRLSVQQHAGLAGEKRKREKEEKKKAGGGDEDEEEAEYDEDADHDAEEQHEEVHEWAEDDDPPAKLAR